MIATGEMHSVREFVVAALLLIGTIVFGVELGKHIKVLRAAKLSLKPYAKWITSIVRRFSLILFCFIILIHDRKIFGNPFI